MVDIAVKITITLNQSQAFLCLRSCVDGELISMTLHGIA